MRKTLALAAAAATAACTGGSTAGPTYPDPGEPNDTPALATPLALGTPVVATIAGQDDRDHFRLDVPAGGATVRVRTFDQTGASCDPVHRAVDTYLEVLDAGESPLLSCPFGSHPTPCDDSGLDRCEDVTVSLPEGAAYVRVSGYRPVPFVYVLDARAP
ncbi:MAG TPA: hypothetical protein VFL83_15960 [Anaeromyxobacter sp.]|nr:hypothetical protein [Anaeromyxobacter sp.]